MRLRTRLLVYGLVMVLVTTAGAVVIVLLGRQALDERAFAQLRSVREAKANQIEDEIARFFDNLDVLAASTAARTALVDLPPAFAELGEPSQGLKLADYYLNEFVPRVVSPSGGLGVGISFGGLAPRDASGRRLQELYIATNPWPVGRKDQLADAGDGSRYSQLHAELHPFFREAVNGFGAYDIFLIDPNGVVVYTVFKEIDVGTDLSSGSLQSSGLADSWRASVRTDDLAVTDFEPYLPSYNAPASFAARGVYDEDGTRLGTIAMQLPVDRINAVMTSNGRWSEVGLGASGETYLVADDLTMRNDSRSRIEASEDYFAAISAVESAATVATIQAFDSTIGLQTVDTVGTRDALSGNVGEQIFEDYRGVPVLSSYRPLDLGGADLSWVVMSEIDRAEAFASVTTMTRTAVAVIVAIGGAVVLVVIVASGRITRPLVALERETEVVEAFDFTGPEPYDTNRIDVVGRNKDEIGDLAGAFSRMTVSLGQNIKSRMEVEAELNVAAQIQESMLPLTFPSFPTQLEFQIHARLTPAKEIGGDFFEHGFVDDNHFFFTVGDVSGKGVPAALFMAAIKTLIRSGALQGEHPAELLTRINSELSRENPEMMFATVWIGVIDLRDGTVVYTNAGHNPPARVTASGVGWVEDVHGPMVGPIAGVTYTQASLQLQPLDRLVIYSDGVTEAMSPDQELYGEARLSRRLAEIPADRWANEATGEVLDDVIAWEAGSERSDDVTVMVLQFLRHRTASDLEILLSVPGDGDLTEAAMLDVSDANRRVAELAGERGLGEGQVQRAQVAVDEVLANAVSYSGATAVLVRATVEGSVLVIEVSDNGRAFNPLAAAPPDVDTPFERREAGGLGIHLVRTLMDTVDYTYVGHQNVLTMTVGPREVGQ